MVAPQPRPLTEEQKKNQVIQFLANKREEFAKNILYSLCQNPNAGHVIKVISKDGERTEIETRHLVDQAVGLADLLLEKLYPIKPKEEK
jgi:hypothetical protein